MAMMSTSGPSPGIPISRYGLTQVYSPIGGGKVDIVFVHGLNGDPAKSWTSEHSKIFWPEQLLPPIVEEEKARILVYGYDADVVSFTDGASRDRIHNHAEHLIAELAANRRIRKATERPIVFVAHSLGGLVVKRALIYSSEIRGNYTEHLRSIFVSTYGILFLGTPHTGSDIAQWGSRLEWICGAMIPKKVMDTEPQLVEALKKNNETLVVIDRQFIQLTSRLHIYFFHEGKKTSLGGMMRIVVDEDSASPNIQDVERAVIQQDHSHMCKFENDSAPGFDLVAEGIQRYAGEAPARIALRWESERAEQIAKKRAEVEELLPGSLKASPNTVQTSSTSSKSNTPETSQMLPPKPAMSDGATNTAVDPTTIRPSEPYFIVPPGFRPNAFFVGMEKEIQELGRRLFDKRRRDGTASVLLHGQPGGGKSHLARQYVNKNKGKFDGGIFWINCGVKEEIYHAFWNIKQKVVARDSPDLCDGTDSSGFVQVVKTWFESRKEWLIVFDGISLEKDEDELEFINFVPDSKNSSIIYVSRQKSLESKQVLLRPHPIKVGPLKEADAVKLLFKELGKKKPNDAEKKKAQELAKKTGGLPLAIDAISHRLIDTHEPLQKYKLSTSTDPTLETTYNQIFDDLLRLGHTEAWNLINILCWFAGNIPVEMVHFGLQILRAETIDVKSREGGGKPDINITFGTLMRYALIERNEPDSDKDSMSSSRDSLSEPEPIDMLKLHGVVQSFCCDSLNARKMLPTWLGYAVKLFSYSYHQADIKIKQKPDPGRVSDYRHYLVHGQRLLEHTVNYESKNQPLDDLRQVLNSVITMIYEEIERREPSSSQENLKNGVFQVSIFDRTSSSSDSNELHGPHTPDHRPTPPHLDSETMFGFPLDKGTTDSPRSFGTASPGLRPDGLEHGQIRRPLEAIDLGYESDRETQLGSHAMQQTASQLTERPPNRSRASTVESHVGGWQIVLPTRKPKKPSKRRDLGSFRPTVSRAQLNKENAANQASQASQQPKLHRRESSPAFKALEKMQSRTSPPPLQSRIAGFIQRTLSGQSSKSNTPQQPTWAGVAAGRAPPPPTRPLPGREDSANADQVISPVVAEQLRQRGQSDASLRYRPGSSHQLSSSPLATEFVPYGVRDTSSAEDPSRRQYIYYPGDPQNAYGLGGAQSMTPYPGGMSGPSHPSNYPNGQAIPGQYDSYYAPPPIIPNNAPLPIIESTTITTRRPVSAGYASEQQRLPPPSTLNSGPASQASSPQSRPSPPYTAVYPSPYPIAPAIPAGYSSQPMSRDHSHQSAYSAAATEPTTFNPTFSPRIGPTASMHPVTDPIGPLPVFAPQQRFPYPFPTYPTDDENSTNIPPREGRPIRRQPQPADNNTTPIPSSLSNLSSSFFSSPSPSSFRSYPPSPPLLPAQEPMSRNSSSGPGIQLTDGNIVAFNAEPALPLSSSSHAAHGVAGAGAGGGRMQMQFGAHEPISVEEARRRAWEADMRLRAEEAGEEKREKERVRLEREGRNAGSVGKGAGAPYPDINLIPTRSDGAVLRSMVLEGPVGMGPEVGVAQVESDPVVLDGMVADRDGRSRGTRTRMRPGGSREESAAVGLGVDFGGAS